jgi:NADH:ubiquinone oxidoreductase subunit F (NADH-binding)/NADH:ubiquinone oxidoreductase subunit E/NAD-dependent dihydropyrimidine dehydrogenase PreA subunit
VSGPADLGDLGFYGSESVAVLDPAVVELVDAFLSANPGGRERLVPLLQCVQDEMGYLPRVVLELAAERLGMSPVEVAGIVSFYHQFTATPRAPFQIRLCSGTACYVRDGELVRDAVVDALGVSVGGVSADGLFNLEEGPCIGACGLAPAVTVNGVVHGGLTAGSARRLVNRLRQSASAGDGGSPIQLNPLSGVWRSVRSTPHGARVGTGRRRSLQVCSGSGCVASGAVEVAEALKAAVRGLAQGEGDEVSAAAEMSVELGITGCRGFCAAGPLVRIPELGLLYCGVAVSDAEEVVRRTGVGGETIDRLLYSPPGDRRACRGQEDIPFFAGQQRQVLRLCGEVDPERIEQYESHGGYQALRRVVRELRPEQVIRAVMDSGLVGRGGTGFPTGRKWQLVAYAPDDVKYVVCNGDEGDPGAFMDRSLMEGDPHSVLEGMAIAGFAVGACVGYLYLRADHEMAVRRLLYAAAQARERGYLGDDIMGSGFAFDVRLVQSAGAYVCGEETALIASIEGRRGMPSPRPPSPATRGLWGSPTLINNVETLANVPQIILDWAGSRVEPTGRRVAGTKTFALTGAVRHVGLVEVELGTTLRQIVFGVGGGPPEGRSFKAAWIGGPGGGCLSEEHLDTPMDYASLEALGATMGSGGLVIVDDRTCSVRLARYMTAFCVEESCGKCPPCRVGTRVLLGLLERICDGRGEPGDLERIESIGRHIRRTSLCGLGQSAPQPVLSALAWFRDEFRAHLEEHRCPSGQCSRLVDFRIDPAVCDGCGDCVAVCPEAAIAGDPGRPYVIDPEACSRCGVCVPSCPLDAIETV